MLYTFMESLESDELIHFEQCSVPLLYYDFLQQILQKDISCCGKKVILKLFVVDLFTLLTSLIVVHLYRKWL